MSKYMYTYTYMMNIISDKMNNIMSCAQKWFAAGAHLELYMHVSLNYDSSPHICFY